MGACGNMDKKKRELQKTEKVTNVDQSENSRLTSLQTRISLILIQDLTMSDMLTQCVQALVEDLDAAFARIWTHNESENVLELQASAGMYTHIHGPHGRIAVGKYKIGLIAQERAPHLTNSVVGDPRVHDQEWAKREGMVSFAGYPLVVHDQLVGVLAMFSRTELPATTLHVLGTVAKYIGVGIQKKHTEENLRARDISLQAALDRKSAFLALLQDVATTASTGSIADSIRATLKAICDLKGWPIGHGYLISQIGSREFVSSTIWFLKRPGFESFKKATEEAQLAISDGLPGLIVGARKPVWLSDLSDPVVLPRSNSAIAAGLKFGFGFPVYVGAEIVAVMEFFSDSLFRPDEELESLVIQVGAILGRAFERKKAHDALLHSEERHRILADTASDAIITIDERGTVVYANPATNRLFGHPIIDVIGREITMLMPDRLRNLHRQAFARHVQTGCRHMGWDRVELTALHESGREFPIELSLAESKLGALKFFTGIIRDVSERKNSEAELQRLSAQLLQLQDEERRKIARDLHDSVGQIVAALSMNISVIQSQSHKLDTVGARAVSENAQLVQQVSDEIRTLSHLLHPPLLEIAGLASALRWYVDGFSERSRIKIDLDIPSAFDRLPQGTELAIFRIVQECLTNIHRHSGSDTGVIRIRHEDNRLVVEVQDRGTGIPWEKQMELKVSGRGGVGFAGMRERLRPLGGTLEIRSDENGTLVSATIKL
jgi:PAS domain S-box-containing protein